MSTKTSPENILKQPGWIGLTLAYPALAYVVRFIPNPMVPDAILALNMIFPCLAGYFYGPLSGAFAGALGTAIAALLRGDQYDALAILPHALMGLLAGLAGSRKQRFLAAASIIAGHLLNMLFFWRFGLINLGDDLPTTLLGLTTETTVDIVAILLLSLLLQGWLYQSRGRW